MTPTYNQILQFLYKDKKVYEGLDTTKHKLDLQGWNSSHPLFNSIIGELKPQYILEIGTWKGGSAVNMITEAKKYKNDAVLICVDTWLGSSSHWDHDDKNLVELGIFNDLAMVNGYPHVYYQFLYNIYHKNLSQSVIPLPQTSNAAYEILCKMKNKINIEFDLIYIDAGHDYDSVYADLKHYYNLVRPGGAIMGDDYNWVSVNKAVSDFVRDTNLIAEDHGCKYLIRKAK